MIAAAVAVRGKTLWESYRRILADPGLAGADFFKAEGGATTVFNMGINGLFATFFVLMVGGQAWSAGTISPFDGIHISVIFIFSFSDILITSLKCNVPLYIRT